jgi:hypothetical protein
MHFYILGLGLRGDVIVESDELSTLACSSLSMRGIDMDKLSTELEIFQSFIGRKISRKIKNLICHGTIVSTNETSYRVKYNDGYMEYIPMKSIDKYLD